MVDGHGANERLIANGRYDQAAKAALTGGSSGTAPTSEPPSPSTTSPATTSPVGTTPTTTATSTSASPTTTGGTGCAGVSPWESNIIVRVLCVVRFRPRLIAAFHAFPHCSTSVATRPRTSACLLTKPDFDTLADVFLFPKKNRGKLWKAEWWTEGSVPGGESVFPTFSKCKSHIGPDLTPWAQCPVFQSGSEGVWTLVGSC